jgi:hypothetical protein
VNSSVPLGFAFGKQRLNYFHHPASSSPDRPISFFVAVPASLPLYNQNAKEYACGMALAGVRAQATALAHSAAATAGGIPLGSFP